MRGWSAIITARRPTLHKRGCFMCLPTHIPAFGGNVQLSQTAMHPPYRKLKDPKIGSSNCLQVATIDIPHGGRVWMLRLIRLRRKCRIRMLIFRWIECLRRVCFRMPFRKAREGEGLCNKCIGTIAHIKC